MDLDTGIEESQRVCESANQSPHNRATVMSIIAHHRRRSDENTVLWNAASECHRNILGSWKNAPGICYWL